MGSRNVCLVVDVPTEVELGQVKRRRRHIGDIDTDAADRRLPVDVRQHRQIQLGRQHRSRCGAVRGISGIRGIRGIRGAGGTALLAPAPRRGEQGESAGSAERCQQH